MTQQQNQSEIARLLSRIDAEYTAARQALHGLASGTVRHDFIIARKEQIACYVEEIDNRKDQVMTVFKVTLANLGMWVRDHYFPASYAHASWHRLQPFFQLPGRIFWGQDRVKVELKPFNDRALNRDLEALCAKVAKVQPCLPDGRSLFFRVQGAAVIPLLDAQETAVA